MSKKLLLSFTIASLLTSSSLLAEESLDADLDGFETEIADGESGDDLAGFDESETNDELDGFGDEEIVVDEILEVQEEPSNFTMAGNIAFKTAYGYKEHSVKADSTDAVGIDYQGINQAQTSLYLQVDGKLSDNWRMRISGDAFYDGIYDINDEDYNDETLDAYTTQLRFDDTYVQGRLSNSVDLKVGRQIVVWGKSDNIRITDVINPMDNRLPGITDIEDLRLSTTMAKLDYYLGDWNFSAMAIVESRIFLEAAPRSEYFPVDKVFPSGAPNPFIELEKPESSWENMQYAVAANGVFSGWDLSFYGANVLDSKWHIETTSQNTPIRRVSPIKMLGSAINIATGSFLLKGEIAYRDGIKYNSTTDEKSRLDTLVGVDYMGISDTVLSLEIANRHIFDYEDQMSELIAKPDYVDENELQTAIRATRSFSNDTLNATLLLSMFGASWEYGGFFRASLEYDVVDAVVANIGLIDYMDGDKPFVEAIKDNDKIFADITYSF